MSDYLNALEFAISDMGHWSWWTSNLPTTFQVEFGRVLIWNPPSKETQPPSNRIALCFREPRLIFFLDFQEGLPADWPTQLARDKLSPPHINHEVFTLTSTELCSSLVEKAVKISPVMGDPGSTSLPIKGEAILGFEAGSYGMVIAAKSLEVLNHHGVLDSAAILTNTSKWWDYWREYWRRKDTPDAMPEDYVCEVTIPAGADCDENA